MMIKTTVMERQGILRGTSLTTILEAILSRSLIGPYSFPTEVNLGRLVFWVGVAKKFLHLSLSDWPLADGPIEREPCRALWKPSIVSWTIPLFATSHPQPVTNARAFI